MVIMVQEQHPSVQYVSYALLRVAASILILFVWFFKSAGRERGGLANAWEAAAPMYCKGGGEGGEGERGEGGGGGLPPCSASKQGRTLPLQAVTLHGSLSTLLAASTVIATSKSFQCMNMNRLPRHFYFYILVNSQTLEDAFTLQKMHFVKVQFGQI